MIDVFKAAIDEAKISLDDTEKVMKLVGLKVKRDFVDKHKYCTNIVDSKGVSTVYCSTDTEVQSILDDFLNDLTDEFNIELNIDKLEGNVRNAKYLLLKKLISKMSTRLEALDNVGLINL